VLEREALDDLLTVLAGRGYKLIGPTVRQRAVVYDEISSSADLPAGVTDEQDGGVYRLTERAEDAALFVSQYSVISSSIASRESTASGLPELPVAALKTS
jgi:hypothetical protein